MNTLSNPKLEPFGTLGYEVKRDVHTKDLDAKILITSHNSRPGLGKTTLAIKMARDFDKHGWDAEEKAFMSAHEYHNAYEDLPSGSVMVFDELEGEADSRRFMSHKNVDLSQAWAQNRYRNMVTICTLPSVSMLDNRMVEMSDYWINVIDRGFAHPYRVLVNDFNGKVIRSRMEDEAIIRYSDLPKDDPDYTALKAEKHARRTSLDQQYYTEDEYREGVTKAEADAQKEFRNDVLNELYETTPLTRKDLSEFDWCGLKPQSVRNLTSGAEKQCDENRDYRDILIQELYEKTDMTQTDIASMDWCELSQPQVCRIVARE